jgi:hypothetical protein
MQAYKKTALIVTKFLPNTTCAGNLVYLKFIIGLTSQSVDQVTVLVLGDRFSNHEFFIADPNQHNIKYLTSFSKRIRSYHFLSSPKLLLKNLLRRSWSMLPSSARKVVYEKYMSNIFLSHSPQSKLMPMDQQLVSMVWCHIDKLRPDYVIIDKLDYIDVLAGENAKPFRSLVICHDLLSQRQISANMTHADTKMHSTGISKEIEMKKLGLADCIVCIQQHEARMIAE